MSSRRWGRFFSGVALPALIVACGFLSECYALALKTKNATPSAPKQNFSSGGKAKVDSIRTHERSLTHKLFNAESARKFRRTVYAYDDWLEHRMLPDRYVFYWKRVFESGLFKSALLPTLGITSTAMLAVLWNGLMADGYTDFSGVFHEPLLHYRGDDSNSIGCLTLPLAPFTLSGSAVALMLTFRTNFSYSRWDEARKAWGLTINHTRNLVRMSTAWVSEEVEPNEEKRREALEKVALSTWAFARSQMRHVSNPKDDEENYINEIRSRLPAKQAEGLIAAMHRPNRALLDLSEAVNELPMNFLRKNEIDKDIVLFGDTLGSMERLFSSPLPLFYTRHTARILSAWLTFLPFGLWDPFEYTWNHVGLIPTSFTMAVFLFGIDLLAVELEEPFSVLPMQAYCDKISANCDEIVGWETSQGVSYPLGDISILFPERDAVSLRGAAGETADNVEHLTEPMHAENSHGRI